MVDLALGTRRRRSLRGDVARDFFAITGLFATLYAWFVFGAALSA